MSNEEPEQPTPEELREVADELARSGRKAEIRVILVPDDLCQLWEAVKNKGVPVQREGLREAVERDAR